MHTRLCMRAYVLLHDRESDLDDESDYLDVAVPPYGVSVSEEAYPDIWSGGSS